MVRVIYVDLKDSVLEEIKNIIDMNCVYNNDDCKNIDNNYINNLSFDNFVTNSDKIDLIRNIVNYGSDLKDLKVIVKSEFEALTGYEKVLEDLKSSSDVDMIRYVYVVNDDSENLLGIYNGDFDTFTFTRYGLNVIFPLRVEVGYRFVNKCIEKIMSDKKQVREYLELHGACDVKKDDSDDYVPNGYKKCFICRSVYPLKEPYFSEIISASNKEHTTYLNICRKCELLRVNDEFNRQRIRDMKGKWLRDNTLLSDKELMKIDIEKIPLEIFIKDNKYYKGRTVVMCVETGGCYNSIAACERAFDFKPGSIRKVIDNENKDVCGFHFVSKTF